MILEACGEVTDPNRPLFYIWWVRYPAGMRTPPQNYKVGQENSRAERSYKAKVFTKKIWEEILTLAIMFEPHTLREYCEYLNYRHPPPPHGGRWAQNLSPPRGGRWSPGQVSRIMKQYDVTAKSLLARVTRPPARVQIQKKRPADLYKEWAKQLAKIDTAGRWERATGAALHRTDRIRHPKYGEGQAVKVRANGRILCRFISDIASYEIDCPVAELDVFFFTFTREERQKASLRIAKKLGLP